MRLFRSKSLNTFKTNKYLASLPNFKTEKSKQYLTIILTLSASIFFALFAINPTLSTITKLKKEIEDNKVVEEKLSKKINSLSALSQQYQTIEEDIVYVTEAIPLTPEVAKLTAQVQSVARNSGISVNDITVSPIELSDSASKEGKLNFELSASGPFDSLLTFLNSLTNMERVVGLDSITLSQKPDSSDISIVGSSFFKK